MTAGDIARLLRARRSGEGRWRARCPVHRSKGLTLAIYAGRERALITCHAGCSTEDVLATLRLTWKDTIYRPVAFDPKAAREQERQRRDAAAKRFNLRVGEWILRFVDQGYTRENRADDITTVCSCALILARKSSIHWERILETHLARIMAAEHCRERGMLPESARIPAVMQNN